jgi:hypothetical protein
LGISEEFGVSGNMVAFTVTLRFDILEALVRLGRVAMYVSKV